MPAWPMWMEITSRMVAVSRCLLKENGAQRACLDAQKVSGAPAVMTDDPRMAIRPQGAGQEGAANSNAGSRADGSGAQVLATLQRYKGENSRGVI